MQNPMVQQMNLGVQREFGRNYVLRADYLHNFRNSFHHWPHHWHCDQSVVGGPDSVTNLESSVKTKYDGLLVSVEKRFANHYQFRASYTLLGHSTMRTTIRSLSPMGHLIPTTCSWSTGPHQTINAIALPSPVFGIYRLASISLRSLRLLRECRWIFSFLVAVSAFPSCNAMRAADCFTTGRVERISQTVK